MNPKLTLPQTLQYGSLLLLAAALPTGWYAALMATLLVGLTSAVRLLAERRTNLQHLHPSAAVVLIAPVVYWIVLAISMLWSQDLSTGWHVLWLKAVLLVLPLSLLLTDMQHLETKHLRQLGYVLLASMGCVFLYLCGAAIVKMVHGASWQTITSSAFDPRHHAYSALYTTLCLVFAYHQLQARWGTMHPWERGLLIASLASNLIYTVLVNSRAGMLAVILVCAACLIHLAATRRNLWLGIGLGAALVVGVGGAALAMPGHTNRLASTAQNAKTDARTYINRYNWQLYTQSPLVGYGVGDYHQRQVEHYNAENYEAGMHAEYNAHNQYIESLLSAGILGLLALLLFVASPLQVLRTKGRTAFAIAVACGVVMLNLLFESMLERQMGLLFISFTYAYIALIMNKKENKFGGFEKK